MSDNKTKYVADTSYAIEQDINVDGKHYIFAVDENAEDGMYYFVCNANFNELFTLYTDYFACDNYAEAMIHWLSRLNTAFKELMHATEQLEAEIGHKPQRLEKKAVDLSVSNYENKVCVVNAEYLVRGSDNEINQLVFIKHGNGTSPDLRGMACFGEQIYSGESVRWERYEILGVLKEEYIPDWAKEKITDLQNKYGSDIVAHKED